jgi:Carboxypeptidase regulatory-like domain
MLTRHTRRLSLAAVLVAILSPIAASAQRGQDAGLVGTIRDTSGAVLVAANVTVSSPQLIGGVQTAAADGQGTYRFPFLPPGVYEIVADHAGFKRATRAGITLLPGLTFTVDFQMDVTAVTENVRVDAPAPVVDVRTSASPVLIDRTLLENLPLSRTVSDSVNLVPGVVQNVAFGGSRYSNLFSLDGTNGNEPGWGTPLVSPNLNWIQELQLVSLGADAQYGEYTGALANAITRSGSNRFSGFGDIWTTRPGWTGNNRGSLTPQLQERFRPIEIVKRWDSDLQVGGPLVKNRLWFFSGGEVYRNANRPASFNGLPKAPDEPKYDATERKFITKLTSAWSSAVRAEGYVEHDSNYVTGANAGPLVRPEALAIVDGAETMWNARLLWTLNARAFVEVRHGGHNFVNRYGPPDDRRPGPAGHFDQLTGVYSVNTLSVNERLSRPFTTGAHFTYFAEGHASGSHEIRSGFEYEHAKLRTFDGFVGGRAFLDYDGRPDLVDLWEGATYRPTHSRNTFYAQDAWSAADRLTLNLGVRAGFYRGSVPGHDGAFSAHSLSPRIGAAWDVTGDHRTVLRAHYGRYHDEMVTSFYDFLDPLSQNPETVATVVGPNQFVDPFTYPTAAAATIDPGIKYAFVEEYLVGAERQLPWGISAKAHYISRDFKDSIGFVDPARMWQPVQKTDPGPDGRLGTADDGGPVTVFYDQDSSRSAPLLTNPKGAYRRYHGVQLIGTKRYAKATGFQASYTWSRTVGSYNNGTFSNAANKDLGIGGVFVNPNLAVNAEGRTPQDFTHEVKILGTYRLSPWGGLNVSGVYRYQSGRPWARSARGFGPQTLNAAIYMEPRGTRELPAVNTLDLRLEKTWKPSLKLGTLGVFADVFNVGNQGVSLRNTELSGPNFGVPAERLEPRTLRAGVRVMF